MTNNGREEGQFVGNNVRSITSITPPLPLFSSQTGRVARTGRRRCRRNASYICVGCTRDGHIFVPLPRCRSRWQSKWQPAFPRPRRGRALVRIHICTSRRVAVNDTGRNFATMSTFNAPATFFPAEFPYGFHAIPFVENRAPKTSASNARQGSHDRGSIDSDSRPQNCRCFVTKY